MGTVDPGRDLLATLSPADRHTLDQHGFAEAVFRQLATRLARGELGLDTNILREPIAAPAASDIVPWAPPGSATRKRWDELGTAALARGEVAVLVLNGGMATRFGGVVKGVVEVLPGRSFLGLRLADIAKLAGSVEVFLLDSFATDRDTRAHLEAKQRYGIAAERLHYLMQKISLRLTPDGKLFRDGRGQVSFYAPGHGDLFESLSESEAFQRWRRGGGRYLHVSNVDNLGATLTPTVIGAHLDLGKKVTVEVAARAKGDKGGAPARVGRAGAEKVVVLEGFRFPKEFPIESIPVFNTNSMIIDGSVAMPQPLSWFRADKEVEGKPVVQLERLMGEVTSFVDSAYLEVPREGPEGRFLPVKTPEDFATLRPIAAQRYGA